jgi:hypothetical protein
MATKSFRNHALAGALALAAVTAGAAPAFAWGAGFVMGDTSDPSIAERYLPPAFLPPAYYNYAPSARHAPTHHAGKASRLHAQ